MIFADSSVWTDYLRESETPQTDMLDQLVARRAVIVGDLIIVEVLQGIVDDKSYRTTETLFKKLEAIEIAGPSVAFEAARNYRHLRALGITVRKTIDTLIATRCIMDGYTLLYSDRDFDLFVTHLGLRSAMA